MFLTKKMQTNCPTCQAETATEKKRQEDLYLQCRRNDRVQALLGRSGIPQRFLSRNLDNYRATQKDQQQALKISKYFASNFEQFLKTGASLIFCGKPGTGKTHLATAIANAVCHQGRSAVFMSVLQATRVIKDTWGKKDQKEADAYKTLVDPDLLILDEVGVQFGSEAEKLILFEILNGRYESVKPTIVISNLSPAEITEFLGERVISRLKEGGGSFVAFTWDDYRGEVLKDKNLPDADVKEVVWK